MQNDIKSILFARCEIHTIHFVLLYKNLNYKNFSSQETSSLLKDYALLLFFQIAKEYNCVFGRSGKNPAHRVSITHSNAADVAIRTLAFNPTVSRYDHKNIFFNDWPNRTC